MDSLFDQLTGSGSILSAAEQSAVGDGKNITIKKNSDVQGRYKKQSGGHGQFGDVKMRFEPSGDNDKPYIFEECVVGGAVIRDRLRFLLS